MTKSKKTDSEDGQLLPHSPDRTRDQSQKQRLGSRAHVASRHNSPNAALHNSCERTILSLFQLTHPKLGEEDPSKTLKTQPRKRDWIFRLPSQLSDLQRRGCFCVLALSTSPTHTSFSFSRLTKAIPHRLTQPAVFEIFPTATCLKSFPAL